MPLPLEMAPGGSEMPNPLRGVKYRLYSSRKLTLNSVFYQLVLFDYYYVKALNHLTTSVRRYIYVYRSFLLGGNID